MKMNQFRAFILLSMGFIGLAPIEGFMDESIINSWASSLGKHLNDFTHNITGYKEVLKIYKSGAYTQVDINGTKISIDFASSLESLLHSKTKALMSIKDQIQKSEKEHVYNPKIQKFTYRNVHSIKKDNTTLVIKPEFSTSKKINTTYSYIQVPTNVYENDPSVLNAVQWTDSLDKVFTTNYKEDPTLLWQYFGNADNGIFRTYPGNSFGYNANKVDLYDSRKRTWFIQASSSPKDIIIVIDGSGTMIGNNFGIARVATLFLIDTLQENDFFNVIYFNTAVTFPIPCLSNRLIQATNENRQKMKAAVNLLKKPAKTGNVELAMETALKLLKSVRGKSRESAGCNQVISFFSDGVEGSYAGKTSFERYNKDKHVRVFSYLVGRKKDAPSSAMSEMACKNRGYFYKIETVGNIWDSVLKYLSVLSRPLALSPSHNLSIYTPLYLDASGLGMMMTVATAVFKNTTIPENAALLGVAGTDIAVSSLENRIPYEKVGVNGYGFALNNNGFLLFHPKLRGQAGYLPSPPNVYLEDLELNLHNQSVKLKVDIIDKKAGHKTFKVFSISKNGKRVSEITMNYFYSPTTSTPFGTCVVIPSYGLKQLQAKTLTTDQMKKGLDALKSTSSVKAFVAAWLYCNITAAAQKKQELSKKAYPTAEEIRAHVEANDYNKCDETLVKSLLLSAESVTAATLPFWNETRYTAQGVDSLFFGTSAGYARTTYRGSSVPISRNFFNEEFYEHAVNYVNVHNQSIVFSVPIKNTDTTPFSAIKKAVNKTETLITVSVPVRLENKYFASVLGMKVKSSKIREIFLQKTVPVPPSKLTCADNNTIDCYLIDESGYIVASNGEEDEVGRFLGFVQGKLLKKLSLNTTNVLKKHSFQDTQAECQKEAATKSSATRLLSPFLTISGYIVWWSQTLFALLAQFSLYSTFSSNHQVLASTNVSCIKQMNFYVLQDLKQAAKGQVDCSKTCKHGYVVSKVKDTNLALVVADKPCGNCKEPKVSTAAVKIADKSVCKTMARYRTLIAGCKQSNAKETRACGSANRIRPELLLVLVSALALYFLM